MPALPLRKGQHGQEEPQPMMLRMHQLEEVCPALEAMEAVVKGMTQRTHRDGKNMQTATAGLPGQV